MNIAKIFNARILRTKPSRLLGVRRIIDNDNLKLLPVKILREKGIDRRGNQLIPVMRANDR